MSYATCMLRSARIGSIVQNSRLSHIKKRDLLLKIVDNVFYNPKSFSVHWGLNVLMALLAVVRCLHCAVFAFLTGYSCKPQMC